MLIVHSNGSKWMGQQPDTISQLIEVLAKTPLDPQFEEYGNFMYKPFTPSYDDDGKLVDDLTQPIYPNNPGAVAFFGNFYQCSHVFNIDTDEPVIIDQLTAAIRANQATEAYQQARRERGV